MPTRLDGLTDETRDQLAQLAQGLANNKETRKGFLGLIKKASPQTPIPEIDEVNAVNDEIAKRDAKIAALEKRFEDDVFSRSLAATKNTVRDKYGLSDDDMKKLEERMGKQDLPADYEWAARLHKQEMDVATPTNFGDLGYHGPLDVERHAKTMEGLMEDTDNWSKRTAHALIDDIQKKGRAPSF